MSPTCGRMCSESLPPTTISFRNCLLLYHKIMFCRSVTRQLARPDVMSRTLLVTCAWNQVLHKQKSPRPERGSFVSRCHMIKGKSVQAMTVTSLLGRGSSFCLQITAEFGNRPPEDFFRVQQLRHCLSTSSDSRVTEVRYPTYLTLYGSNYSLTTKGPLKFNCERLLSYVHPSPLPFFPPFYRIHFQFHSFAHPISFLSTFIPFSSYPSYLHLLPSKTCSYRRTKKKISVKLSERFLASPFPSEDSSIKYESMKLCYLIQIIITRTTNFI
jgi:hypothetical protein